MHTQQVFCALAYFDPQNRLKVKIDRFFFNFYVNQLFSAYNTRYYNIQNLLFVLPMKVWNNHPQKVGSLTKALAPDGPIDKKQQKHKIHLSIYIGLGVYVYLWLNLVLVIHGSLSGLNGRWGCLQLREKVFGGHWVDIRKLLSAWLRLHSARPRPRPGSGPAEPEGPIWVLKGGGSLGSPKFQPH